VCPLATPSGRSLVSSSEEQTQLLTDIRHDCVRTSLHSGDDAATGDVQESIDEPLQATQSRRMKYPAG
jgi:hypothetical protein